MTFSTIVPEGPPAGNPGGVDRVLCPRMSNWLADIINNWADWICIRTRAPVQYRVTFP